MTGQREYEARPRFWFHLLTRGQLVLVGYCLGIITAAVIAAVLP